MLRSGGWGFLSLLAVFFVVAATTSCSRSGPEVVVYVAHDRVLSEPTLQAFEAKTGIRVLAVYDIEANKTIGLTNRLLAESDAPRADVFWNNEVIQTIRLQARGIAATEPIADLSIEDPPIADASMRWVGFGARARVFLLNTRLVAESDISKMSANFELWDLAKPEWKGRAALANPRFGTTGTHFAALLTVWGEPEFRRWLRALRSNDIAVLPGNAQVRESVASGRHALGLTDTDDAVAALNDKQPVHIMIPSQTLLIPNSVALVARSPHPELGARLVEFLLSAEVEAELARGRGAQVPLNHGVPPPTDLPPLTEMDVMPVDFPAVAQNYEIMLSIVEQEWPPGTAPTAE